MILELTALTKCNVSKSGSNGTVSQTRLLLPLGARDAQYHQYHQHHHHHHHHHNNNNNNNHHHNQLQNLYQTMYPS